MKNQYLKYRNSLEWVKLNKKKEDYAKMPFPLPNKEMEV
jgi:hypothetical protein